MLFFIFVYMFIIGINIIMVVVVMTLRRRQRQRLLNEQMAERWCRSLFPKQSSLWWSWAAELLDAIWTKPSKRIWTNEWALPPHFPYVLPSSIHPSIQPSVCPSVQVSIYRESTVVCGVLAGWFRSVWEQSPKSGNGNSALRCFRSITEWMQRRQKNTIGQHCSFVELAKQLSQGDDCCDRQQSQSHEQISWRVARPSFIRSLFPNRS